MNLLFVCSRNKWRSLTAETIFKNLPGYYVRSAGTSDSARIKLNESLVQWADIIFVMEKKHKQLLFSRFSTDKQIITLDIPDEYEYMDEELIGILKDALIEHIN